MIWIDLDDASVCSTSALTQLDQYERSRVERLSTTTLRSRAAASYVRRRQVLADYLGVEGRDVVYRRSATGKPSVVTRAPDRVNFAASQCGRWGLLAFGRRWTLGVDAEANEHVGSPQKLIDRISSESERSYLDRESIALDREIAVKLWVRKEAYFKATGEGIGRGMGQVSVPLEPDCWATPFHPVASGPTWLMYDVLAPDDGLRAALVISMSDDSPSRPAVRIEDRL